MERIETKKLETNRLILRKFEEKDYKGMFDNWASDYKATKHTRLTSHKGSDNTKKATNKWNSEYETSVLIG